jgi:hypothetical protein
MGRRGFYSMRSPWMAAMIALASVTGQARTLPGSRTAAGGMMPCPKQADLRVVALMATTALSSAYSALGAFS